MMTDNKDRVDTETIIREIRRIAAELGSATISRDKFISMSSITARQLYNHFDSWNEAVEAAGLTPTDRTRIPDEELFREMKRVFESCGGICTQHKFERLSKHSITTYISHWGTKWTDVKLAFRAWIEKTGESFPFLDQLPSLTSDQSGQTHKTTSTAKEIAKQASYEPIGGARYGPPLNFRGLQHAPINEQGVVFLFGMVCTELGFRVEAVRTSYPDCEAKRRVKGKRDEWERVRIEFEYSSSRFDHDPRGCDVIVCWEHDWPECPLEVIELKTAIQSLPDTS